MADLLADIQAQTEWIIRCFKSDKQTLDYSIESLRILDEFFDWNLDADGKPKGDGRLAENVGPILFGVASYVGETIIKNSPGAAWVVDNEDPDGELTIQVKLNNGTVLAPSQRVIRRFHNGKEDGLYAYGLVAVRELSRADYWEKAGAGQSSGRIDQKMAKSLRPWWKFWER